MKNSNHNNFIKSLDYNKLLKSTHRMFEKLYMYT